MPLKKDCSTTPASLLTTKGFPMIKTSGKAFTCGLIGDPVAHSFSPRMHQAGFEHFKMDADYLLYHLKENQLPEAFNRIRDLKICGINVTVPHKEKVLEHLDEISELSKKIGAVNTIYFKKDKLCGTSTDPAGILNSLKEKDFNLKDSSVAIIGTGGSARTAAFTFAMEKDKRNIREITIHGRNLEKAEKIALEIKVKCGVNIALTEIESDSFTKRLAGCDLALHATTLGMHPLEKGLAFDPASMKKGSVLMDIIYNPRQTLLMQKAEAAGIRTISGLGMLVHQGLASFEIWFGKQPPASVFYDALKN
jgi:shikimate dehydrogenase